MEQLKNNFNWEGKENQSISEIKIKLGTILVYYGVVG